MAALVTIPAVKGLVDKVVKKFKTEKAFDKGIEKLLNEQADEAAVENLSKVEEVFGQNTKVAEALSQDGISMTNESVA